jgi:hypothetical protein
MDTAAEEVLAIDTVAFSWARRVLDDPSARRTLALEAAKLRKRLDDLAPRTTGLEHRISETRLDLAFVESENPQVASLRLGRVVERQRSS